MLVARFDFCPKRCASTLESRLTSSASFHDLPWKLAATRRLEEGGGRNPFSTVSCPSLMMSHASKPLASQDSQVVVHGMAPSHATQIPFPHEAFGSWSRVVDAFLMDIRLPQCRD